MAGTCVMLQGQPKNSSKYASHTWIKGYNVRMGVAALFEGRRME